MGKVKAFFRKKSIKTTFTVYMLVCIVSAVLVSLLFSCICQFGQAQIYKKYAVNYENSGYSVEIELYEEAENKMNGTLNFYTRDVASFFTPLEDRIYNILKILSVAVYPICFVVCIGITSTLFYKRQIQKPLEILDKAADNIADNNLDFNIVYNKQDELGKLCLSFEKMRAALQDNNMELWRQIEERKRLNRALSHDLRTPLTVLKGQSEMLIKYVPQMSTEKIISTAEMMQKHIIRLEAYVNTMNDLQRLEDIEIEKKTIAVCDVIEQMQATGASICKEKKLIFDTSLRNSSKVCLDFTIVMRVYENLLSNAFRFAKTTITVCIAIEDNYFKLTVSDDGNGFTNKDIANATKPFYKTVQETDKEHFGIGLNICKILCEKHGGYLTLSNKNNSGASVTAIFYVSSSC